MIERVVLIRLKPEYRDEAGVVAAHTKDVLGSAVGVQAVKVGVSADERTTAAWDVMLSLTFADIAAVETYRADPRHRKYLEVYLRPLLANIRAFNFEVGATEVGATEAGTTGASTAEGASGEG